MTRLEKCQLAAELVEQFLYRRERLIKKFKHLSRPDLIVLRMEMWKDLGPVVGRNLPYPNYELINCWLNRYLYKLGYLLPTAETTEWVVCTDRLEEIISLYHQLYFNIENDDSRVFTGDCQFMSEVMNRLESLRLSYFIIPNYENQIWPNQADWRIQLTAEGFDLYQSKYRHDPA